MKIEEKKTWTITFSAEESQDVLDFFLKEGFFVGANLTGADLKGASLRDADLAGANFWNTSLVGNKTD